MPELGYRLEDRPGAPSAWKPDDPALLRREAAERQATKLAAQRKKAEQTLKLKQTVRRSKQEPPCLPASRAVIIPNTKLVTLYQTLLVPYYWIRPDKFLPESPCVAPRQLQ